MAKVLDSLPDSKSGRRTYSDWAPFADGQVWQLTLGEDIKSDNIATARRSAYQFAQRNGIRVSFRKLSDTEFAVQFTKKA